MNPIIKEIVNVLTALQQCKANIYAGMSIADAISAFNRNGLLTTNDNQFTYGELCEWVFDTTLPIREGLYMYLLWDRGSPYPVECHVYVSESELLLHSISCKKEFNMELFDGQEIFSLLDVSKHDWYSCGSNAYELGQKSQALLKAIDAENGRTGRSYFGKPIPECWRNSPDFQNHII